MQQIGKNCVTIIEQLLKKTVGSDSNPYSAQLKTVQKKDGWSLPDQIAN